MTEREAYQAIVTQALAGLATTDSSDVPVKLDLEIGDSAASWIRLSVRHTLSRQSTMGSAPNRRFDREGVVLVQVFAPINQGRGPLADLAADVRAALEGQRLGDLVLHAGSTQEVPTDGVWAMLVVSVPFRYSELR